jgi:hypothetical protein
VSKFTPEKRAIFLGILADGSSSTHAAQAIGISRQSMYVRRRNDPAFATDWDDAVEAGTDCLEDEAVKRAKNSSDTLLIFMLKARRPQKFRDTFVDPNSESNPPAINISIHGGLQEPKGE